MANDFLGLVNDVNRRLNEVELTSANFASATGFYSQCKDSINSAIRYINQSEYQWPFNHVEQTTTLTADTSRYAYPTDAKIINFQSFRIKEDSTLGNATTRVKELAYEEYLDKYVTQEYNSNSNQGVPIYVIQAPDLEFILSPEPDKAYIVVYEYYTFPTTLAAATDTTNIPERFRHVIVGAMYEAYMFRSNLQAATIAKTKFDEGIKQMRSQLINRTPYMRSYMIRRNTTGAVAGFGI